MKEFKIKIPTTINMVGCPTYHVIAKDEAEAEEKAGEAWDKEMRTLCKFKVLVGYDIDWDTE